MKKYFLHGKLQAKAGKGEQLAEILLQAAALLSDAPGCQIYLIGMDPDDPDAVWVTEVWDTKKDHDDSLRVDGVRALIGQAMPILDGPPTKGQELEILGGQGIG
ncbi:putative quinol monooxygenase [Flavilitoribacter nigricans]|uniref:Antibiotic biosynthesis monooxygenase n=1 Tax=Flavilitoribacter nigricans (strain ATCC 23147 / DSM 23189 / NBRC 102662 / NCIMB 1420 / SS-2) TaxID=1122177 RepID=A0A2D0N5G0_FLAN2|nr:antibiotic biosynthesis monooxygenase family protein [Flavilitoribacter nigricans]PHN03677.1 antibiotic biosynthesis monooxygenase [Flavilitoribacter nigricans DSM 23189 = NBRC 102662]